MPDNEKIEASPEETAEIKKQSESPVGTPDISDDKVAEISETKTPESEPTKTQHWDREKAEAYFQTLHQQDKEKNIELEQQFDDLQKKYDSLLSQKETPKDIISSGRAPEAEIEEDEEGFDMDTAIGQRAYEKRLVSSITTRLNDILKEREETMKEQSRTEGYLKAEMEQSFAIFAEWANNHGVPDEIRNAAVAKILDDFPGARAPKVFKHAKSLIELAGGMESERIRSARAAALAAKKQKLIDANKPPPEGAPPKAMPGGTKKTSDIIEEKMKIKSGHEIL